MNVYVPEYIKDLKPYKPGNKLKGGKADISNFINLASNENPLGASPFAIKEMHNVAKYLSIYPDVGSHELVSFLAEKLDISPSKIICGHGSDSLIADIVKSFSESGDEIITSAGSFIGYYVNINKLGRKLITVNLSNYEYDLKGIVDSITSKTRVIFLANPNNPTGTMFDAAQFELFMKSVPENVLVVLDEAYHAYSSLHDDYPDGLSFGYQNLIVLRTFSKSHGLAGLRIGFCVGPEELISILYRVKLPFEPNVIAQKLAKAAFIDYDFVFQTLKLNTISMERMQNFFIDKGLYFPKPAANFLMIVFENEIQAKKFTSFCYENSVLVRHLDSFGIKEGVRISSGTHEQMDYAFKIFEKAINNL